MSSKLTSENINGESKTYEKNLSRRRCKLRAALLLTVGAVSSIFLSCAILLKGITSHDLDALFGT